MEHKKEIVGNIKELISNIAPHGEGRVLFDPASTEAGVPAAFICSVKCNDGTIIDFYGRDTETAAQIASKLRVNEDFLQRFIEELVSRFSDPDPFVSTIKGHSYIESLITSLIKASFLEASELELDRMTFVRKVKVCVAAGLIHKDVARALEKLAKIRNRFAHQLWPSFSQKEEKDFLNVLRQSNRLKEMLSNSKQTWRGLPAGVWVLYLYLFEQLLKVARKRELILEFWKYMVEVKDDVLSSEGVEFLSLMPIDITAEEDKTT